MSGIEWSDRFEVGHPRIDGEHREYIELIRAVALEAERGGSPETGLRRLQEVRKYAEFHFLSEENIMLDAGYPSFEEHRAEHEWLLRKLERQCHLYATGDASLAQIARFIYDWFAVHTEMADKRLVHWVGARAMPGEAE